MYDIFILSIGLSVSRILLYIVTVRTFYFLNIILENTSYSFFLTEIIDLFVSIFVFFSLFD